MRVAIIPARGGSRRIPRKNIRLFHGKPIIQYSVEAARASGLFDHIAISTDDDQVIGWAFLNRVEAIVRPARLSVDEVGTQEVARHALRFLSARMNIEQACCIYATAPLMTAQHLTQMHEIWEETGVEYAYVEGWLYWGEARSFIDRIPIEGHSVWTHPENWIDINTEDDWKRAEEMYAALHREAA